MRVFILLSVAVLAICGLVLPALRADDAKDELKKLDGKWKVVGLEADGRKAPAAALKDMSWTFTGAELRINDPGAGASKSAVKLDPGKSPRHIDLIASDGPAKGKSIQGIYKHDRDRLVICFRDAMAAKKGRPTAFATGADAGLGLITLERIKE